LFTFFYPDGGKMFLNRLPTTWMLLATLPLIATSSCSDERVTQGAREAADRQAQQNTEMAQVNREVAAGSHQLVEADAKARQEIVGVHRDLQSERSRLDTSWSQVRDERMQIAAERRTESTVVAVANASGYLFLVVVVLGFCWYALVRVRQGDGINEQLNELLVSEILLEHSALFAAPEKTLLGLSHEAEAE
jgi:hypothetical protein